MRIISLLGSRHSRPAETRRPAGWQSLNPETVSEQKFRGPIFVTFCAIGNRATIERDASTVMPLLIETLLHL
jgi:hypothetical protein